MNDISYFKCKPSLSSVLLCAVPMWFLCSFADCSAWTVAGNYLIAIHSLLMLLTMPSTYFYFIFHL
jgi:hypothetical protein